MDTTVWADRTDAATKHYRRWAEKYKCKTLEEYYRGFQWQNDEERVAYVLNMIYTTLEIKLASYSFQNIQFHITPKPSKADYELEFAVQSAQVKEDALNTVVGHPNGRFCDEIEASLKDSYFRFGVLEVGYSANWLDNPNAGKPLYRHDVDPNAQPTEKPIIERQPDKIPDNELIFFKRIDPSRFRVGGIEGRYLDQCNWYGYYDWYYAADIKKAPNLKNLDKIETVSARTPDFEYSLEFEDLLKKGDLLKVWKIWDTRAKKIILWEEANDVILYEQEFTRTSIFDLRWATELAGWYPIPPVFQWISPQDEINEARQQMRSYRRRFVRQFQTMRNMVLQEEIDKFEQGKDGSIIVVERDEAIKPIADAPMNNVVMEAMVVGKGDIVLVSGTSSESMGQADRITATQSLEIARRFGVRESRERVKVANWVTRIGREALNLIIEKFIMGLWIKSGQDSGESIMQEVQLNQQVWQYISSQQLDDGIDFDVNVQLTTMSPLDNDDEKRRFMEFIAIMSQFPQIAMSPLLIREAAYRVGYRNEKVIREMQTTSLLTSLGQMAGAIPQGGPGQQTSQQIVESQSPTTMSEVNSQIKGQLSPR